MKTVIFSTVILLLSIVAFPIYAGPKNTVAVNIPPGLQHKVSDFPRELEKKEKRPSGWDEGEKRGWDREHPQKPHQGNEPHPKHSHGRHSH